MKKRNKGREKLYTNLGLKPIFVKKSGVAIIFEVNENNHGGNKNV